MAIFCLPLKIMFLIDFVRFANILILLIFPESMMMGYDIWMSNVIALKRYQEWPEIKIFINVRCELSSNLLYSEMRRTFQLASHFSLSFFCWQGAVISIIDAMALGFLSTVAFPMLPPFLLTGIFYVGLSPANDSFSVIILYDLQYRSDST